MYSVFEFFMNFTDKKQITLFQIIIRDSDDDSLEPSKMFEQLA